MGHENLLVVLWPATASPGNRCSTGEDVGGAHWTGGWRSPNGVHETVRRRGGGSAMVWYTLHTITLLPMRLELGYYHHRVQHTYSRSSAISRSITVLDAPTFYNSALQVTKSITHCPDGR